MDRYDIGEMIGEGAFGQVFYAKKKSSGEHRAIKRIKDSMLWQNATVLRELESITRLMPHPNIVQLYELIRTADSLIHFVFEYMPDGSLLDLLQHRSRQKLGPLPDLEIRWILYQILQGLRHVHEHRFMHRDIKPENLLLRGRICKVADFSLARRCRVVAEGSGGGESCTTYVATRWYRAPEILLHAHEYDMAVDIFATGCILAELYRTRPLFTGRNELDQLVCVFNTLGTPESVGWSAGVQLLHQYGQEWPSRKSDASVPPTHDIRNRLRDQIHRTARDDQLDKTVLDMLLGLLYLDPTRRWTASSSLQHDYFGAAFVGATHGGYGATENQTSVAKPSGSTTVFDRMARPNGYPQDFDTQPADDGWNAAYVNRGYGPVVGMGNVTENVSSPFPTHNAQGHQPRPYSFDYAKGFTSPPTTLLVNPYRKTT